jgi:hypothetical protein
MNQRRSSCDCLSLFPHEPDIWVSLDKPVQEKVLDCLALLLLQHLQHTAHHTAEERSLPDEYST